MSGYEYRFDFDGGIRDDAGNYIPDPPHVYITKDGSDFLEVFEDPLEVEGTPLVDEEGHANEDHWKLGPGAIEVLDALRSVNGLRTRVRSLSQQIEAQATIRRRQYRDDHDYLPYAEDDRD